MYEVSGDTGIAWEKLVAVLRACALAPGIGVQWENVWPTMAGAVLGKPFPEADEVIRAILTSRLAGYIATVEDDGVRLFRPNHEKLTEALSRDPHSLIHDVSGPE